MDIIGHLTARMLLRRDGTKVNVEKVIDAAKANGVALEINSQPHRLDLCDSHARLARDRGVKLDHRLGRPLTIDALDYRAMGRADGPARVADERRRHQHHGRSKKFLAGLRRNQLILSARMDAIAEIKKLYYAATKATIQKDLERAIDLLKTLPIGRGSRARRGLHGRTVADAIGMEAGDAWRRRG